MLRYDNTDGNDHVLPPSNPREGTEDTGDYEDADSITVTDSDADTDTDGDGDGNGNTKPAVPYSDVFFDDAADKQNTFKPQRRASESRIIHPPLSKWRHICDLGCVLFPAASVTGRETRRTQGSISFNL